VLKITLNRNILTKSYFSECLTASEHFGDFPYPPTNGHPFFIRKLFFRGFYGVIWNALVKSDVYIKGLYLLSNEVLNIYKNLFEDRWWASLIYSSSNNLLIIKRFCYLYFRDLKNNHLLYPKTIEEKDRTIHEFVYLLYLYLNLLPKEDDKKNIIEQLNYLDANNGKVALRNFRTKFYILDNLIKSLIKDPYVKEESKISLKNILNNSYIRQKEYEKI